MASVFAKEVAHSPAIAFVECHVDVEVGDDAEEISLLDAQIPATNSRLPEQFVEAVEVLTRFFPRQPLQGHSQHKRSDVTSRASDHCCLSRLRVFVVAWERLERARPTLNWAVVDQSAS